MQVRLESRVITGMYSTCGKGETRGEGHWRHRGTVTVPPPSTDASGRPTRTVRMGTIEVPKKGRVQDELSGDPRPLLRAVSLPVHQVLVPPAPSSDIQDPGYSVGRMIVDEPGGWRGLGRRAQRTGGDRFNEGGVEDRMHLESGGKLKAYGHRIYYLHHLVRTNVTGSQLLRLHLEWNVPGGKPHLLLRCVRRSGSTTAVGRPFVPGCRTNQRCPSLPPDSPAAA